MVSKQNYTYVFTVLECIRRHCVYLCMCLRIFSVYLCMLMRIHVHIQCILVYTLSVFSLDCTFRLFWVGNKFRSPPCFLTYSTPSGTIYAEYPRNIP